MKVTFEILGEPKGKGRPRHAKRGNFVTTYTDKSTVMYENLVRTEFERQCSDLRFNDEAYLDMRIYAYYSIPKSTSKKKKELMIKGIIRPSKKPDIDNVLKVIADSLNQVAYKDDVQIVDCMIRKFYSEKPRVVVVIEEAKN